MKKTFNIFFYYILPYIVLVFYFITLIYSFITSKNLIDDLFHFTRGVLFVVVIVAIGNVIYCHWQIYILGKKIKKNQSEINELLLKSIKGRAKNGLAQTNNKEIGRVLEMDKNEKNPI